MARHASTVCFSSPLGHLEVEAGVVGVTRVRFNGASRVREVGEGAALEMARSAREEIRAYLSGQLRVFSVPSQVTGTAFQRAVWKELALIPYGETRTYGEIASRLGRKRGARAVGSACRANPLPILIPCHRVVSTSGGLGGFQAGLSVKARLLALERESSS